jgi:hypothetical protein
MRLYPAFGEEPKRFARLGALSHSKNLNFHRLP